MVRCVLFFYSLSPKLRAAARIYCKEFLHMNKSTTQTDKSRYKKYERHETDYAAETPFLIIIIIVIISNSARSIIYSNNHFSLLL